MPRFSLEPSYLLSSRPYSDSSLLLEAFTRDHGRIGLVARGARGPRSRLRGLLQPFQGLLLSWNQSGELGTLTGAEARGVATGLPGERVFYGWYVNELLLKLMQRHDAHPGLFALYGGVLPRLAGHDYEVALRLFEKHLLAEIGYGIELPGHLDPAARYHYDPERGPVAGTEGLMGTSLIALRDERVEDFDAQALTDTKRLLRSALQRQLGGKELKTPAMLRNLRESGIAGGES